MDNNFRSEVKKRRATTYPEQLELITIVPPSLPGSELLAVAFGDLGQPNASRLGLSGKVDTRVCALDSQPPNPIATVLLNMSLCI